MEGGSEKVGISSLSKNRVIQAIARCKRALRDHDFQVLESRRF